MWLVVGIVFVLAGLIILLRMGVLDPLLDQKDAPGMPDDWWTKP